MMNSPNLTTVPLPPTNGRSIGDDSRRPASRGMLREPGHRIKTGENSRPTNGEYSTPAHRNRIPDAIRERIVQLALDEPELSPRELATRFTDTANYFVSEASVY